MLVGSEGPSQRVLRTSRGTDDENPGHQAMSEVYKAFIDHVPRPLLLTTTYYPFANRRPDFVTPLSSNMSSQGVLPTPDRHQHYIINPLAAWYVAQLSSLLRNR